VLTRSRRARWPALALVAGLLLADGAAAGYAITRPPRHDFGTVPPATARPASHKTMHPRGAGRRLPGLVVAGITAVPSRLKIPAIGVNAPIVPVGVATSGGLGIPDDPSVVGWWAGGSAPGRPGGATVLVGHIDSAVSGPGALFRLADLRPGERVTVIAGGRAWRYVVAALRAYLKTAFPATAVFGQQVTTRLVIVSCGGPFDYATGHYLDNIVAYATPAGPVA
jgi:hypothetical protein